MQRSLDEEVERYVRTGEHDNHLFVGWPGNNIAVRAELGHAALAGALVAEVRRRTPRATLPDALRGLNTEAFARAKLAPMVRGLFPRAEQEVVLTLLGRAVVFLTPDNIETILRATRWPKTAWDLANLYAASFGGQLLADDAPHIVGLSEDTTCYVSVEYFRPNGRFEDFVVHEAAHVFHNWKRESVGLPHTRWREWLLEIAYAKRETLAYACEAYSRILELGSRRSERQALLLELRRERPPADTVDMDEYFDILREAVTARNGWKRILTRCAPTPPASTPPGVRLRTAGRTPQGPLPDRVNKPSKG